MTFTHLSDHEKRVRIGVICGKENIRLIGRRVYYGVGARPHMLPNYTESLDAMHEAEKTMDSHQCYAYEQQLYLQYGDSYIWKATAMHRANAFLAIQPEITSSARLTGSG